MSTCERPLEPMLTAELAELEGTADTDLGRHVRDCPRCSAAARKILAANAVLNDSLVAQRTPDTRDLVDKARSGEAATAPIPAWRQLRWPGTQPGWRWVPIAAGIGTLAIAAILLAVVGSEEPLPGPEWKADPITSEYGTQPLLVDAPGYNVAVIPTANPDITIFWFSKEDDDVQEVDPVRDGPIAIGPGNGL